MYKSEKKIVLTGGGTAGHVMPHIALLPILKEHNWEVFYIGSKKIEKTLAIKSGLPFYEIAAGKLRRYISLENLIDIFRTIFGLFQSIYFLFKIKPDVVFSKGGYVSVPVCYAAFLLRIPVLTHESDYTPGLANKLLAVISKKILLSFEETKSFLTKDKLTDLAGIPVREELFQGDSKNGWSLCGFKEPKPTILFMGGSLGAKKINETLEKTVDSLLKDFNIIHIAGKGKKNISKRNGYIGFEFLGDELKDILAISDYIVSRAGANSIFEFLSLNKPMLLIPLKAGSRGDQVDNTQYFTRLNWATTLDEDKLSCETLLEAIQSLKNSGNEIINSQKTYQPDRVSEKILKNIEEVAFSS